jgi:hypothetical protein
MVLGMLRILSNQSDESIFILPLLLFPLFLL